MILGMAAALLSTAKHIKVQLDIISITLNFLMRNIIYIYIYTYTHRNEVDLLTIYPLQYLNMHR